MTSKQTLSEDILNRELNGNLTIKPIKVSEKDQDYCFNSLDVSLERQAQDINLKAAHYSAF